MRKSIKMFILMIMMLSIVGCGNQNNSSNNKNNKLICESEGKSGDIKIVQKYTLDYDKDIVTKVKQKKVYSFYNEEEFKSFKNIIDSTINDMKELENNHIRYKSKEGTKSYTLELIVDMTKATNEELESLNLNKDLNELKNNLELQGLTCK